MTQKISIPKPCHENWNDMLPEAQGRHCLVCSKTVIDFSQWEEQDILNYLQSARKSVCGRFRGEQVIAPSGEERLLPAILQSELSFLKKIAAIVLLCFGVMTTSSCVNVTGATTPTEQQRLMGEPAVMPADTATQVQPADSLKQHKPIIMGKIAPYRPAPGDTARTDKGKKQKDGSRPKR